jgi:hypothetical protein
MSVTLDTNTVLRALIESTENWEKQIEDASIAMPRWFVTQIGRGTAELGMGFERSYYKFHKPVGDQAGLSTWKQVYRGRAAGTGYTKTDGTVVPPNQDPGNDPCKWVFETMGYGFEKVNYYAYNKAICSHEICARQVCMDWQYRDQIDFIYSAMPDQALQCWENMFREYFRHISRKHVLAEGHVGTYTFAHNPFTNNVLTIAAKPAGGISALTWAPFDAYRQQLLYEVGQRAASGMLNGNPAFLLCIDDYDWSRYLLDENPKSADAIKYANPQLLLAGWPFPVSTYRGWMIHNYPLMPRYKVTSETATAMTLTQILPYNEEDTTIGSKWTVSNDYLNAEYAEAFIVPKDPFKCLITPSLKTVGGGTSFESTPSLAGDFEFKQFPDKVEDPRSEKGTFMAFFEAFMRETHNGEYGIRVLYRRCVANPSRICEPCGTQVGSGAVDINASSAANVPAVEGDDAPATSTQVDVTLAECLPCEVGPVTVSYGQGPTTVTAYIALSGSAPTYRLTMPSDSDWATLLASGATVECGATAR